MRLDGRRALVAGGSRGIGLACAVALAEAGAHVIAAARGREELEASVAAMKKQGMSAEAVVLDLADVDATKAVLAEAGPIDVFVNSAGMSRHTPALETKIEDYDTVMGVNLRGAYFATREAARSMISHKKRGSIINISSQMGLVGGIDRAVYCATKHGVEGMTKAMAIEWGKVGIRVNTIGPTFIRTRFTEASFANPERYAWIMSKIKLDRVGEIEDIMGATVFLASDAAAMVTGTHLLIDGGWTAD
jgi:NAD(P)-dependent dehydrogenase (short-subunit alcohol dehydrogenase family)